MYREVQESPQPSREAGSRASFSSSLGGSVYASTILSVEEEGRRRAPVLNDQQWVLQRKKIGLSRKSKKTRQAVEQRQEQKANTIAFYRANFTKRECVHYVHNPHSPTVAPHRPRPCHCGAPPEDHRSRARAKLDTMEPGGRQGTIQEEDEEEALEAGLVVTVRGPTDQVISSTLYSEEAVTGPWKESLAMQAGPTNAYGSIQFDGNLSKPAKYLRLGPRTDMAKVSPEYLECHQVSR